MDAIETLLVVNSAATYTEADYLDECLSCGEHYHFQHEHICPSPRSTEADHKESN